MLQHVQVNLAAVQTVGHLQGIDIQMYNVAGCQYKSVQETAAEDPKFGQLLNRILTCCKVPWSPGVVRYY